MLSLIVKGTQFKYSLTKQRNMYTHYPGEVLEFNGDNYIQKATLVEDTEFIVKPRS